MRQKLGCNVTVRATGRDDLLRQQMRRRLGYNVTVRATGSSEHWEQRALGALSQSQLPLIQQRSVQAKMKKFHTHLATLEVSRCSTCLEAFPGLHLQPGSTECTRCGRDKHTPKLYSSGNNVDPGPIPAQLQVIIHVHMHVSTVEHLYSHMHY